MNTDPINLSDALATFDQLWSPRIVTRINDYDIRVAKVRGVHMWHTHDDTDELFLVLDGTLDIGVRDSEGERLVHLETGDVFVVPRGVEHRPQSADGASLFLVEPSGTSTTGDRTDDIPAHIDSTIGHELMMGADFGPQPEISEAVRER